MNKTARVTTLDPILNLAKRRGRGGNKRTAKDVAPVAAVEPIAALPVEPVRPTEAPVPAPAEAVDVSTVTEEKKPAARNRRARKPKAAPEAV